MNFAAAVADLPAREQILIWRAGAHAVAESALPEALRFRDDVTDLGMARLIHLIERGAVVVPTRHERAWVMTACRTPMPHLTRTVREGLRLGLLIKTTDPIRNGVRTRLRVAAVHWRMGVNRAYCADPSPRVRTATDIALVDCKACLALHG